VNLQGALQARRHAHGRVLLVDDVSTTGATLSACADVLASAGARDIRALVFARDL
jgi:predicted amidophosphoribosyltransferase